MEVLRGRYRKNFREYPTRRIVSQARKKIDQSEDFLKGLSLTTRQYSVALSSQDRDLAMAASGSLSLLGHNIHVVGREVKGLVRREQISTRRRQRMEDVSYDVKNNYEPIQRSAGQPVGDSSESSCEEDQLRRSSRSCAVKARKHRRKNDPKSRKKRRQDDPAAEVPQPNIKLEPADEENNEVKDLMEPGTQVKGEEQEWYQPDIEDFFDHQEEEPDHQMDKEEAEELLGFLSGGQETTGEVFCAGDEDILLEEMMREECEERPLLETARSAVAEPVLESSVDISIINEFNLLD